MLPQPPSCIGCPLHGVGTGFMIPSLSSSGYGVTLLGEALGEKEAEVGKPFSGPSGFKLTRLIEWAGLERKKFDIINSAWCRPPGNKLDGEAYEFSAVNHCRSEHWGKLLSRSRVIVPMGNVAMAALIGKKGILSRRGYITSIPGTGIYVLPTVHPSFIQRGQSKYSAAFIHDLQTAVEVAKSGFHPVKQEYVIDPSPYYAMEWANGYRRECAERADLLHSKGLLRDVHLSSSGERLQDGVYSREQSNDGRLQRVDFPRPIRLAYDIETPYKLEDESESPDEDSSYTIDRIGFSYRGGEALSIPWTPEYIPAIRLLLEGDGEKVVWNGGFDNPRIRHNGVAINGLIHDGMIAWHILHSDLPKGLAFVATFTCPFQPEWKSLSSIDPGKYNATDADVEWKSFDVIERELRESGLWEVYQADVLDLEPILAHMSKMGMPIDPAIREDRAAKLESRRKEVLSEIEQNVPIETRRFSPKEGFKKAPKDTSNLITIGIEAPVRRCSVCGICDPKKTHFKTFLKPTEARPQNPCGGAGVLTTIEHVQRFARVEPFKPSREQLIRYNEYLGRPIPTKWDKSLGARKRSMDEKALKSLIAKYPGDGVYPRVLVFREIDKIAGTYIGRVDSEKEVVV